MLRRRTLSLWLILGALFILVSCLVVRFLERDLLSRTEQRVASLRSSADRITEQRLLRQAFLGSALASGRLPAILAFLEESGVDFVQVWQKAEETGLSSMVPEARARREEAVSTFRRGGAPVVDLIAERLADALFDHLGPRAFGTQGRASFVATEKAHLVQCLAVEPSFCRWDYAYTTLLEELADLSRDWRLPVGCRILVVSRNGTGLADSRRDDWSNIQGFCDAHPFCRKALETRSPRRDLLLLDGTWHLATAVPLNHRGEPQGAVLILDPFNQDMVREDSLVLGTEVAYSVHDNVIEFSPSLGSRASVERILSSRDGVWVSSAFPLFGVPQDSGARMLVAVSREGQIAPFYTARKFLLSFGLVMLLAGLLLYGLVVEAFLRQIERLYQGVHEIIHGNPEYRFPTDHRDETLRNLGMALNVMGLLAQGKPLVDEEENARPDPWIGASTWESLDTEADSMESSLAAGDVPSEDLQADLGTLASEPAESYHRRLYQEFLDAHRDLGLPPPPVSQEDFLTRVVHLEQKLRRRYGVAQVRFLVSRKHGQVVLTPVRIRSGRES